MTTLVSKEFDKEKTMQIPKFRQVDLTQTLMKYQACEEDEISAKMTYAERRDLRQARKSSLQIV